jgi:D-beta-D-heptose 7-phosphate kinase/D-beta-D-heptose 1-phosphate adenosyltransferase
MTDSNAIQLQTKYKILLIGDNCEDVYQYGTVDRISPEAPVPVFKFSHEERRSGMAGNVARNLEAMGCEVNYLHGKTSTKTRLVDRRSRQHIVRIDNDVISDPLIIESEIPNIYDAIVVSDYDKGTVSYELIEELIATSLPVFIDTKKTDLERMQGAWVKINELEYSKIKSECTGLIVTRGANGATAAHYDLTLPAPQVEVADVTGAGDTFLAALTVEWLAHRNLSSAMQYAIRAASITVQHFGVYAPRLEEIK